MRNTLILISCLLLLTACAGDDYFGGSDRGRHDDRYGYGGGYGGGYSGGYGNYYPYGNVNYPRDRIYIIDRYHSCHGYAYQGYCYRYKDDYRNAVAWDRKHGYDDNWHKKRKDWCNKHDCSRDHDSRNRAAKPPGYPAKPEKFDRPDARPAQPRTDRARADHPRAEYPVNSGERDKPRRDDHSGDDRWGQERRPDNYRQPPVIRQPVESHQPEQNNHQREQNNHQRTNDRQYEQKSYQSQPRIDSQPRGNGQSRANGQQRAEPVQQRSQPSRQAPQENRSQGRKSQSDRSASPDATVE